MTDHPFAISLDADSGRANHTGSWRTERPVYVDLMPPCSQACPAGEDVRGWLSLAEEGNYEQAWRLLVQVNPFPAVMGRICYHPCQTACNRAQLDEAVGIHSVERFLGDLALANEWRLPQPGADSGRRVLVVGAGPAGLAAAYHLRLAGHAVRVVDAGQEAGGLMRYGIPAYRLPRAVLVAEIDRLLSVGVELELAHPVTDIVAEQAAGGFDAVLLAIGAPLGKRIEIPAGDASRLLDAVTVLHDVAAGTPPSLGRRVAVYGGGDTALDAARTARRLGAEEAVVVYRRTEAQMPAHRQELHAAEHEGVTVRWLSTVAAFDAGGLVLERMELGSDGFPQPTGELESLPADSLVLAVGQDLDTRLVESVPGVQVEDGHLAVDVNQMTGRPGLFAAGDLTAGERTATTAIGLARRAAAGIDAWLRGAPAPIATTQPAVPYTALNTWYFSDAPGSVQPRLSAARRVGTFDEIEGGLDESTALFEARRCMSCGSCFECDNCYGVCPDSAVIKLGPGQRYEIDLDYCKGCGLCAAECPSGAVQMQPEPL